MQQCVFLLSAIFQTICVEREINSRGRTHTRSANAKPQGCLRACTQPVQIHYQSEKATQTICGISGVAFSSALLNSPLLWRCVHKTFSLSPETRARARRPFIKREKQNAVHGA
jgi:hypothetical protein